VAERRPLRDYDSDIVRDILADAEDTIIEENGPMAATHFDDLTPAEQALVEKMVYAVVEKAFEKGLKAHVNSCPTSRKLDRMLYLGIGVACGSGLLGAGITAVILRAVGG